MAKHFTLEDVQAAVEDAITGGEYSIPKIAASLHTSERTFYRRVRELTGVTPKAVISDIQMNRCARLLLEHPDKPLGKIALMCGFEEASGLSHAYQRPFACNILICLIYTRDWQIFTCAFVGFGVNFAV